MHRIRGVAWTALILAGLFALQARPIHVKHRLESRRLAAVLDDSGFLLEPSGWGLSPRAWGRPGRLLPLARTSPHRKGGRVSYLRPGILEWHEARPEGIEQGFDVLERPEGEGPLVVEQEVRGGLVLKLARPDGLSFGAVEYRGLKAFDAGGRALPARMALSGRRLSLVVEDEGAAYPVRIDPLSTAADWIFEANRANSQTANSVRLAGDVNGDGFSDFIVGMYGWDNAATDEGRAVVFHGGSGGLSTTVAWSVESNQTTCYFGLRSDTAGDVNADGYADVIVSAPYYGNGAGREGRVWIHHGSVNGLSTASAWLWETDQTSAEMGWGLGPAGDVNGDGYSDVAIGITGYDNGANDEGRVVVFYGKATGIPATASWMVDSDQTSATLGSEAGSAGDVNGDGFSDLLVSATNYSNGESQEGRAWVYLGSANGLSTTVAWTSEGGQAVVYFGQSAVSAGDVNGDGFSDVLVGAPYYDNGQAEEGRAFVFHGSSAGLSTTAAWVVESNQASAFFGNMAYGPGDVNGDGYADVVVGSYGWANGEANEGRAWVYHGGAGGLSTALAWSAESSQANAYLTVTPAGVAGGDVNGDGFSDLMAGARLYGNGEASEGRAYVFHGNEGTVAYNTYELPGRLQSTAQDPGSCYHDTLVSRVVRDSNGFWYFAWTNRDTSSGDADIYLSYATTSTPTSSTDWTTVTLVDDSATGVITQDPANTDHGSSPVLAMSADDQLHFCWIDGNPFMIWTKCTNLSALTVGSSWATRIPVPSSDIGLAGIDIAMDPSDNLHMVFEDSGGGELSYTRYNSGSGGIDTPKALLGTAYKLPRISADLDGNVYVLYHDSSASPYGVYLLCSTNAYATSPANSVWRNLAQTTTTPDTVNSSSTTLDYQTAADLCVDYNNIVHVVWRVAPGNPNGQCIVARDGRINQGWAGAAAQVSAPGPWKRPLAMVAIPDGSARLFSIANGGSRNDAVYWTQYTGVGDPIELGSWSVSPTAFSGLPAETSQAIWAERRMPRNRTDTMWFLANDAKHRISTSWTDRFTTTARWSPPIQEKRKPHPHLAWVFPNTASDCGTLGLPVVSQYSKWAVYVMDPAAAATTRTKILALDRSRGTLARSYYTGRGQNDPIVAAAWGSKVHLFVSQSGGNILKLADDGSSLERDAVWANNPQDLATGTGIGSMSFLTESGGTRYLYVTGTISPFTTYQHLLHKLKADNGVKVWQAEGGFGDYSMTTAEHPFRILNDQIFMPGNVTGLFRMDSDSSGEISAPAIVNNVRKLVQVRGSDNNRLFVSPNDRVVYQLTSGLATTGWTSGKSANLGATKTSGAYYMRTSDSLYVGAGNQLFRLNAADGGILSNWPMAYAGCIPVLPVQWKTFVYFGMSSGRLFAVNATTNVARANWPVALDTTVSTPAVRSIAFDAIYSHVYFSTDEGRIFKFNLE